MKRADAGIETLCKGPSQPSQIMKENNHQSDRRKQGENYPELWASELLYKSMFEVRMKPLLNGVANSLRSFPD